MATKIFKMAASFPKWLPTMIMLYFTTNLVICDAISMLGFNKEPFYFKTIQIYSRCLPKSKMAAKIQDGRQ